MDIHEFVKRLGNPGSFDVKLLITSKQDEQTERTNRETFRDLILYLILSGKSREFVLLKATSSPSRILFLLSRRPLVPEERRFLEWSTRYIFIRLVLTFFSFFFFFWSFLKLEEDVKKGIEKKLTFFSLFNICDPWFRVILLVLF